MRVTIGFNAMQSELTLRHFLDVMHDLTQHQIALFVVGSGMILFLLCIALSVIQKRQRNKQGTAGKGSG